MMPKEFDKTIFFLTLLTLASSYYIFRRYQLYQNNIIHQEREKRKKEYIDVFNNKQLITKLICMIIFSAALVYLGRLINPQEEEE